MSSQMSIEVEFLAGTALPQAVIEAKKKAKLLDVAYIKFKFNGVSFSIGGNADFDEVLKEWARGNTKHGIVSA